MVASQHNSAVKSCRCLIARHFVAQAAGTSFELPERNPSAFSSCQPVLGRLCSLLDRWGAPMVLTQVGGCSPKWAGAPPAALLRAPAPTSPVQHVLPARSAQRRQPHVRPSALPTDALGALPPAATAAAAASLLTALWMRRAEGRASASSQRDAASEGQQQQVQQPAQAAAEPPSTPEAIWAAAWQGFAPPAPLPKQEGAAEQMVDAAASRSAAETAASGAAPEAQQQQQQQQQAEEAPASQDSLQRTPVLLLQVRPAAGCWHPSPVVAHYHPPCPLRWAT